MFDVVSDIDIMDKREHFGDRHDRTAGNICYDGSIVNKSVRDTIKEKSIPRVRTKENG